MNNELETKLYNIDKNFFEDAISCINNEKNEKDTCMVFGCECRDGWFKPLETFVKKVKIINDILSKYHAKYVCEQIKEKFGEIRVYYKFINQDTKINKDLIKTLDEMMYEALNALEEKCSNTCEWCGSDGGYNGENMVTTSGWISRICKKCAKEKAEKETLNFDQNHNLEHIPRITLFKEGYWFLNPYHVAGFKYKDNYYSSIMEAFFSIKDEKHKKLYKRIVNLNTEKSAFMIEVLANEFGVRVEENDYDLLKDIVKAKFSYEYNKNIKDELLETEGKLLQHMGKHHNNIFGHCVCEECKDKQHKDLYAKILMEVREQLKI